MELTEDLLKRFVKVQKKIESFDSQGFFETLKESEREKEDLEYLKKQCERDFRVVDDQTRKQKQDLDNILSEKFGIYFNNADEHKTVIKREQEAYDKSVKSRIKLEKELSKKTEKYEEAVECLKEFKDKNKKALDLYFEQLNILNSAFDGSDGSDLENQLETTVKEMKKEREQLKVAIQRWNNARFLLIYACNQIQVAEERWNEIMLIEVKYCLVSEKKIFSHYQFKFILFSKRNPRLVLLATECINNLLTCRENLEKTNYVIPHVKFPYCTPEILQKILQMTDQLYTDMNSNDLRVVHQDSLKEIRILCFNLKMWFDSVISNTLVEPYAKLLIDLNKSKQGLRTERIRLMHDKILQVFGKEIDLQTLDKLAKDEDNNDMLLIKAKQDETNDAKFMVEGTNKGHVPSDFVLPPPPSKDQLLGINLFNEYFVYLFMSLV